MPRYSIKRTGFWVPLVPVLYKIHWIMQMLACFSSMLRVIKARNCNVKPTWLTEVGITAKCKWGIVAFLHRALQLYFCHIPVNEACKLYVGHGSIIFICHSMVECFNCKWPLYLVLLTVCMITVCVKAKQKQNNWTLLAGLLTIREYRA